MCFCSILAICWKVYACSGKLLRAGLVHLHSFTECDYCYMKEDIHNNYYMYTYLCDNLSLFRGYHTIVPFGHVHVQDLHSLKCLLKIML